MNKKKEMLINVLQPEECRIAIVEDGVLEELYVERTSLENYTGNIYKGKIVNIEPAIQASFVDFSVGRNGFLHVSDVEPRYYRDQLDDDSVLGARDRGRDPRRDFDPHGDEPDDEERDDDLDAEEPRRAPPRADRDREARPRRPDRDRVPARDREPSSRDEADEPPPPEADEPAADRRRPPDRRRDRDEPRVRDRERPASLRPDDREGFGAGLVEGLDEPDAGPDAVEGGEGEPPPPSAPRGRSRGRDKIRERRSRERDRPDLSEKGRRDRSAPRRFGEGLADDPEPAAGPPLPQEPGPGDRPEPQRARFERPSPAAPRRPAEGPRSFGSGLDVEAEAPDEAPPRRPRPADPAPADEDGPYRWSVERKPEPEEYEHLLPPNRTRRDRPSPRTEAEGPGDEPRPGVREADDEGPRGGRGPGRRPPRGEPWGGPGQDEPIGEAEDPSEPTVGGVPPEGDRPRGGRDAIRGRGGRDRPRRESRRVASREPDEGPEPESPEASEPLTPSRPRRIDRAGEPGYVPRRERARLFEGGPEAEELDPLQAEAESRDDADADGDSDGDDEENRRRRRRRRRRGRGRDRDSETSLDLDRDEAPDDEAARADLEKPPALIDEDALANEFDFVDHDEDHEDDDDEEEDDDRRDEAAEEIEPGLQEEIAREIEEIRELEREVGFRGGAAAANRARRGEAPEPRETTVTRGGRRVAIKPPIQDVFRRNDEVLVQVIKESIGTKGPTLSTYISIPGRYLVLMPGLNRVGVSRKIADEGQRRKLRQIMHELNPPKGLGFIVRTAGLDRSKRDLARDLAYLLRLWKVILQRIKKAKTPAPIYQESDMIIRTIRDIFNSEIDTIWIDEPSAFERAKEFLNFVMPRFVDRLKLYEGKVPLFQKYGLEEEINKIQRRQVHLPEGGSIVIDPTEALVAIDVNSGNFRFEDDAERTAYEMNLRAAKEIARQLRLRDLGGVIVNDFIDMREEKHRRGVERALREAVKRDRARTKILRMSQFGLIEMTRQRIRPSLKRSVYSECEHCGGGGLVKTVESMAIDAMRLIAFALNKDGIRHIRVDVSAEVATFLNNRKREEIAVLEANSSVSVHVCPSEGATREHLVVQIVDSHGNEVPFLPAPSPPSGPPPRRRR
ncbi:Rne/Rng family ribonuclease [Tautonia plasticadhaerens]|uniref:Ribonuclease G n=1 Tax=Tautonia plasticadhaerens TaxID=2527974 RepID=A0A518H4Q4_9BACT|nr:Rne/Rng family ribonuclease [Tautonia plasticadhaerens]QDV35825.1 Ribonuclease E [Tautonia plasticadhaerens]